MLAFLMSLLAAFGVAGVAGVASADEKEEEPNALDVLSQSSPSASEDEPVVKPPAPETDEDTSAPAPAPEPEDEAPAPPAPDPTPEPDDEPPASDPDPVPDTNQEPPAPAPAPTPAPEPEDEPPAPDPTPEPDQDLSGITGLTGQATLDVLSDGPLEAAAISGRVTTLSFEGADISEVEILSKPAYGNVTVNPDNSLALVLTGSTNSEPLSFDIRVTHADDTVENHNVVLDVVAGPSSIANGWGEGDFYMLETDENDDVVVEHGDEHRKVHVSGDENALSLADIAAIEGLGTLSEGEWRDFLRDNEDYGSNPDMALAEDSANLLWKELMQFSDGPTSHWLLFERGHTYDEVEMDWGGTQGESELHPVYFGAYGTGDRPVIANGFNSIAENGNIVFQGLQFESGVRMFNKENVLFDDIVSTNEIITISQSDGITLRNSDVYDVYREAPRDGSDTWSPHLNRESGLYLQKSDGVLFEGNLFDHNGWGEGYDPGLSGDSPQPPSMFSHNMYLSGNNSDVTVRDSIIMQGSAEGLQLRSGGVIENNIFIDNNGAFMFGYGKGDDDGNYSLVIDNVVTSAGHKQTDDGQGSLSSGIANRGYMTSMVDNIVAHLSNPADPEEYAAKTNGQDAVKNVFEEPLYNDTIIYNWVAPKSEGKERSEDQNIDGLDTQVLDETTIQKFTADLLGKPDATIADLSDYLRAQSEGAFDEMVDADLIAAFFRQGFGLDSNIRETSETVRFVPDELGDGIRWDNRLNWDSENLPQDGDRVELAGNWVNYSGTTQLEDLDFGDGGRLSVDQGKLEVRDHISVGEDGAELDIDRAGQFWANGYTDQDLLDIDVEGGRFANTGLFTGKADLTVADNGQAILATDGADYVMGEGSRLSIIGDDAKVGFDGDSLDTAVLLMSEQSTLSFTAEDGGIGQISEFRSGYFGDDGADVSSGANLGGAELQLDLTGLLAGTRHELMNLDEIIGEFGALDITGLASNQNAILTIDYDNDSVAIELGALGIGTGAVAMELLGDPDNAQADADLYAALTDGHGVYPDDKPDSIPAEEDNDPFVTL